MAGPEAGADKNREGSLLGKIPEDSNVEVLVAGKDHNKDSKVLILYHGVSLLQRLSLLLMSILTFGIPSLSFYPWIPWVYPVYYCCLLVADTLNEKAS